MNTPQQLLKELNFTEFVIQDILKTMPITKLRPVEFFKLDKHISNKDLIKEYKNRGLVVDPYSLLVWMVKNPIELEDKDRIACPWDVDNYIAFRRNDDERYVYVQRSRLDWVGFWWFGGVYKSSSTKKPEALEIIVLALEKTVKKLTEIINI